MSSNNKKFRSNTDLVLYFLKGNKRFFFLSIIFSILVTFFDLINPKIIQYTVDFCIDDAESDSVPVYLKGIMDALGGREFLREHLYYIAVVVAIVALLTATFRYIFRLCNAQGAEKLIQRMRNKLFEHIMHLPFTWHGENHTGDIRILLLIPTIKYMATAILITILKRDSICSEINILMVSTSEVHLWIISPV